MFNFRGFRNAFTLVKKSSNISGGVRRQKKEFSEYGINFTDQSSYEHEWEEDVIKERFITIKDILLENYKESLKQLLDLNAAKESQKKDKQMGVILDKEIEKEKEEILEKLKSKENQKNNPKTL